MADKFLDKAGLTYLWEKIKAYFQGHSVAVPEYTIAKLTTAETGYISSYVLKKDGVQVGATINIPKDYLVKSGAVIDVVEYNSQYYDATDTSHTTPLPVTSDGKYIDFVVNTVEGSGNTSHIYISVDDLVDAYTAGNGIRISNNNIVSIKINDSHSNGIGVGGDGLSLGVVTPSINGVGGTNGAMLATDKEKLDSISSGGEPNVQSDWNQTDTTAEDYIKNKPTNVSEFTNDADYISEEDALNKILIPNFDNMTPVKTIELDVSATSYYLLYSRSNSDISSTLSEVNDVVLFRITCTGTNIYSRHDFLVKYRCSLSPFVACLAETYSTTAATTGLHYIRFQYPKEINNGYDWICDFKAYNSTARHVKVEVFATTENITWVDSLTATTYNSTYQTDNSQTLYDRRGLIIGDTVYTTASSAAVASYVSTYLTKYVGNNSIKAGESLSTSYFVYVNNGYAFKISNKNNPINADYGINYVGTSYSVNSVISYTYLRMQGNMSYKTDTKVTSDPIAVREKIYLRCRLVGDKIYSDGHFSNKMTAGYTWYLIGIAYTTTTALVNTIGSMFITLDENGMISHINGKPTQAALMNGSYERSFCGEIESDVSANAKLRSIEGRSLVFNQITQNGDFSDGTTGWTNVSSTLSVSDGVLSAYSSTGVAYFGAATTGNNCKVYKDHKYFYSVYAKASKAMNAYTPYFDNSYITKQQAVAVPFQLTTEWQRFVGIVISIKDGQCLFGIRNYNSKVGEATIYIKNAMMIDLTKMFGAGNEPQDTEMLKEMFPLDYYDYNLDGTLIGGTQTGFKSEDEQGTTLTNLSIPITTLTGKPSGSSTSEVMFPNGLLGIGDIRDEIDFENGTAVKRIGTVDLGSLTWNKGVTPRFNTSISNIQNISIPQTTYVVPKYLTSKYKTVNYYTNFGTSGYIGCGNSVLLISDSDYSDAATFKTAMSGVYLHYELATPIEYTIDTVPTVEYETERGGSEQWLPVNTSTPTVAPICCISRYQSGGFDDSGLVHKTGQETITGMKTMQPGMIIGNGGVIDFYPSQGENETTITLDNAEANVSVLKLEDVDVDGDVRVRGVALPTQSNDAANKSYVDGLHKYAMFLFDSTLDPTDIIDNSGGFVRSFAFNGGELPSGTYKVTVMRHAWYDGAGISVDSDVNACIKFQRQGQNTFEYIAGGTYVMRMITSPRSNPSYMFGSVVIYLTGFITLSEPTALNDSIYFSVYADEGVVLGGVQPLAGSDLGQVSNDFILFEKM